MSTHSDGKQDDLVLGPYLDELLNAECNLSEYYLDWGKIPKHGGIKLPRDGKLGTGNIVIRGKAGTGKTTLAMQIAVEAARRNDGGYTAYISFEEGVQSIFQKAQEFNWGRYVRPLNRLPSSPAEYITPDDKLAEDLCNALEKPSMCWDTGKEPCENRGEYDQCNDCPNKTCCRLIKYDQCNDCPNRTCCRLIKEKKLDDNGRLPEYTFRPGKVILPRLEPSVFTKTSKTESDDLFWKRYQQLDDLLRAAQKLRNNKKERMANKELMDFYKTLYDESNNGEYLEAINQEKNPAPSPNPHDLALVCIDGLNAFGSSELTREHLAALFDLFTRRETIGVFIVEENENKQLAGDNPIESDTIDYLADMVIELTTREESGHFTRHFEVTKSRYQQNRLGRHLYRTVSQQEVQHALSLTESSGSITISSLFNLIKKDNSDKSGNNPYETAFERHRRLESNTGIQIYPSLFYIVSQSNLSKKLELTETKNEKDTSGIQFSEAKEFDKHILGTETGLRDTNDIVSIIGPEMSARSLIAGNFLLRGLYEGHDALLIRLGDQTVGNQPKCIIDSWKLCSTSSSPVEPSSLIGTNLNPISLMREQSRNKSMCRQIWDKLMQQRKEQINVIETEIQQNAPQQESFKKNEFKCTRKKYIRYQIQLNELIQNEAKTNKSEKFKKFIMEHNKFLEKDETPIPPDSSGNSNQTGKTNFTQKCDEFIRGIHQNIKEVQKIMSEVRTLETSVAGFLETSVAEVQELERCVVEFHEKEFDEFITACHENDEENKAIQDFKKMEESFKSIRENVNNFFETINRVIAKDEPFIKECKKDGHVLNDNNIFLENLAGLGVLKDKFKKFMTQYKKFFEKKLDPINKYIDSMKLGRLLQEIADEMNPLSQVLNTYERVITYEISIVTGGRKQKENEEENTGNSTDKGNYSYLIELAFKPGPVPPEVFIKIIRELYLWEKQYRPKDCRISRAALLQADTIGVSYPLLYHNSTSSNLFMTSLAHLFRRWETSLTITAHTGGVAQAEDIVKQVKSLATHPITTEYMEVFGDRYLTVKGPGMSERESDAASSHAPAVLWIDTDENHNRKGFHLDYNALAGLVGFETGNIRRPGVILQFYEEGNLHKEYNQHVQKMVGFSLGEKKPQYSADPGNVAQVEMVSFDSTGSEALHCSLTLMEDTLLRNTVIRTVDEFEASRLKLNDEKRYYKNVLLCAYVKNELITTNSDRCLTGWEQIQKLQKNNALDVFYDTRVDETLSCLLMDEILRLYGEQTRTKKIKLKDLSEDKKLETGVNMLRDILGKAKPLFAEPTNISPSERELSMEAINALGSGKFMIIAWYSQIREMVEVIIKKQKELDVSALQVCALPNGGFTGDWYLQVSEQSASKNLGIDIEKKLLNHKEDFFRFMRGVGLPCCRENMTDCQDLMAWPTATVTLDTIFEIHKKANQRSKLEGYKQIRRKFASIMKGHLAITEKVSTLIKKLLKNYENESAESEI